MTIDAWLQAAIADAEKRGLSELKPLLEGLAHSTRALRLADFNGDARGGADRSPGPAARPPSKSSAEGGGPAK